MSALPPPASRHRSTGTPLLSPGDHMKADEFHARYTAMPHVKKAELLDGVVYMPSPVSLDNHSEPHSELMGVLLYYKALTRGVRSGDNGTLRLDEDNEPQPDCLLFIPESAGGQARLVDTYLVAAPDLAAEVTATTRSDDMGAKKDVYAKFGVREYLLWLVHDEAFEWFALRDGAYQIHEPDADGIYRSTVFPGLWLDWQALLTGDLARVFAVVQQGCATSEHAAFVARLASPPKEPRTESAAIP